MGVVMTKPLTPREKLERRIFREFWHWIETGEQREAWSVYLEKRAALDEWDEDPGCGPDCPCLEFDLAWRIHQRQHRPE